MNKHVAHVIMGNEKECANAKRNFEEAMKTLKACVKNNGEALDAYIDAKKNFKKQEDKLTDRLRAEKDRIDDEEDRINDITDALDL